MLTLQVCMETIRKQIPNALTSLNLVMGCLAVMAALNGELEQAGWWMVSAAVLDFFDGFIARALHAQSDMGKQLDSLADMVSFGLAPGMIFYQLSGTCFGTEGFCINRYLALLIPVFSALRLAKFNIDTRQSDTFIGVPTPANGLFIASLPFVLSHDTLGLTPILTHAYFLKLFPLLSAYLLTAEIPMIALKFKQFGWNGNEYRYLLILGSALCIALFQFTGVALAFVLYILLSVVKQVTQPTQSI